MNYRLSGGTLSPLSPTHATISPRSDRNYGIRDNHPEHARNELPSNPGGTLRPLSH
jgi:hypothetical protein